MRTVTLLFLALTMTVIATAQTNRSWIDSTYEVVKQELKTKEKPSFTAFLVGKQKLLKLDDYQLHTLLHVYAAFQKLDDKKEYDEYDLALKVLTPEQSEQLLAYLMSLPKREQPKTNR